MPANDGVDMELSTFRPVNQRQGGIRHEVHFCYNLAGYGADRSMLTLLQGLVKQEPEVRRTLLLVKAPGAMRAELPAEMELEMLDSELAPDEEGTWRVWQLLARGLPFRLRHWLWMANWQLRLHYRVLKKMPQRLRELRPDLVVSHTYGSGATALVCQAMGISCIVYIHGWIRRHTYGPYQWLTVRGIRRASQVIAISQAHADDLVGTQRIPSERIAIQYNSLDLEDMKVRLEGQDSLDWPPDSTVPLVLNLARYYPEKGQDVLLEAFALLLRQRPAYLLLCGDGPELPRLRAQASRLGICQQVKFLDWIADPFPLLKRASLYVLASRWEVLSRSLLEAQAAGLAVVSTDHPLSAREAVSKNSAILVPVDDPVALAGAMAKVLDNPGLAVRMGAAGKKHAARFSQQHQVSAYLALRRQLSDEAGKTDSHTLD